MNPTPQQRTQRQALEDQVYKRIDCVLEELAMMSQKDARRYTDREALIDKEMLMFIMGLRDLRSAMNEFSDLALADQIIAANTRVVADNE